jgi:murein DD-endopeptidase MepM/ murein hydrolase activator NlpD
MFTMKNTLICLNFLAFLLPLPSIGQFQTLGPRPKFSKMAQQDRMIQNGKRMEVLNEIINYHHYVMQQHISLPLKKVMVTSPEGMRKHPVNGNNVIHHGVDLRANYDSVFSIMDGIVVEIGNDDRSGLWIKILHSGRLKSSYAHLSRILVKNGKSIRAGECIGISGNSGTSNGPHLHFNIMKN